MIKYSLSSKTFLILSLAIILTFSLLTLPLSIGRANALSGSQFNKSNIISDNLFFNGSSMSASSIQSFLSSKVPSCDTNGTKAYGGTTRAAYGASKGYPAPYTCLKSYSQTIPSKASDSYCTGNISGGRKTSATIIHEVARACNVSPKVLLVLLQKEQSLLTDDWPWSIQYRSATGYGCPDTAACDSEYYGFFNQVYNAARQYQRYAKQPEYFNYAAGRTSYVQFHPNASCGGGNISIQNKATAGLYNYTPYQPNSAALNNLRGTGNSCSAYGNRNFWRLYNDWFGSTNAGYVGYVKGVYLYTDSARTQLVSGTPEVRAGTTLYATIRITNTGSKTWNKSNTFVGTASPYNQSSPFSDDSWLNSARTTKFSESSVPPTAIATFKFTLKAPNEDKNYIPKFQMVLEKVAWVPETNFNIPINVSTPYNAIVTSATAYLNPERTVKRGPVTKPNEKLYWKVVVKNTGSNTWSPSLVKIGTASPYNRASSLSDNTWVSSNRVVLQDAAAISPGQQTTMYYTTTSPSTTGAYNEQFALLVEGVSWLPGSNYTTEVRVQNDLSRLKNGEKLLQNEYINTGNRRLILQGDGNLVIYNSSGKATWSSATRNGKLLILQGDGNLVLYKSQKPRAGDAVWSSGTRSGKSLIMQGDGNLVLYSTQSPKAGNAVWNSGTR